MKLERAGGADAIALRVAEVRRRMAEAEARAGRRPGQVSLCAACKARTPEEIRFSAGLPIDLFGENRMQEMRNNLEAGAYQGKPCHFIGHLQTNKVRQVVGRAAMIQSVGSLRLLEAIDREAGRQGILQDVLLEINLGGEESKAGADESELMPLMDAAAALPNLRVRGLMAIPPPESEEREARRHFARLRGLMESVSGWAGEKAPLDTLSMGMSGDFEAAILEGATLVRVGRGIYGERP